jgi:RNA polymerase sigma-70 factor (ECF subfamily)
VTFEVDARDAALMAAVRSLPSQQRAAVVLFYLEDRPLAEIAEILGCAAATARVHVHRARARLAEAMGKEEVDRVGD